jgi:hypothetical protein
MLHKGIHLKVYDDYFDLPGKQKNRVCEITGTWGAEVAHIRPSGMGGRESAHVIENLMGMNRIVHEYTEGQPRYFDWLEEVHKMYMADKIPFVERDGAYGDEKFREIYLYFYTKKTDWRV